jgi:hypothetical protein
LIPHDLPDYVERGGRQVWRPPYRAHNAEVFGFVLPSEPAAIDALLQRDLVEPAGGAVDYRCAAASVVVMFASIEKLTSAETPDSGRGYLPELEASVWCLAADVMGGSRLVWHLPYVFVDSGQAAASGREVYGYPKQVGVFESGGPQEFLSGDAATVKAMAIERYGPGAEALLQPMISARGPLEGGHAIAAGARAFDDLLAGLGAGLQVNATLPFGPAPQASAAITPIGSPPSSASPPTVPRWAARRVLSTLLGRDLTGDPSDLIGDMVDDPTLVFLKQFRDASCPAKACYQAIVEAPLAIDPATASYAELDPSSFEITIEDWDSHPIATEVGVAPRTPLQPQAAFRATLDFDIQLGLEVWRAPT